MDYILISESLSNVVENFTIKPGYRSDHSAVIVELKFNSFERGRGFWKFNNSLLTDKIYVDKVKETIERLKIQYEMNKEKNQQNIFSKLFEQNYQKSRIGRKGNYL